MRRAIGPERRVLLARLAEPTAGPGQRDDVAAQAQGDEIGVAAASADSGRVEDEPDRGRERRGLRAASSSERTSSAWSSPSPPGRGPAPRPRGASAVGSTSQPGGSGRVDRSSRAHPSARSGQPDRRRFGVARLDRPVQARAIPPAPSTTTSSDGREPAEPERDRPVGRARRRRSARVRRPPSPAASSTWRAGRGLAGPGLRRSPRRSAIRPSRRRVPRAATRWTPADRGRGPRARGPAPDREPSQGARGGTRSRPSAMARSTSTTRGGRSADGSDRTASRPTPRAARRSPSGAGRSRMVEALDPARSSVCRWSDVRPLLDPLSPREGIGVRVPAHDRQWRAARRRPGRADAHSSPVPLSGEMGGGRFLLSEALTAGPIGADRRHFSGRFGTRRQGLRGRVGSTASVGSATRRHDEVDPGSAGA